MVKLKIPLAAAVSVLALAACDRSETEATNNMAAEANASVEAGDNEAAPTPASGNATEPAPTPPAPGPAAAPPPPSPPPPAPPGSQPPSSDQPPPVTEDEHLRHDPDAKAPPPGAA
jgi:outer membrane biosynthesis protein TonB